MMVGVAPVAIEVVHALQRVPTDACGALIRNRADGGMAGALLVERGRVCWAMSHRYRRYLTDILAEEQSSVSLAQLNELFALCRRDQLPLGETLVSRGLVSLPVLHRALLRHTCEAFDCLIREDASPWAWVQHAGYGYHPMLTFSPVEVITGVRAVANPELAARALARLHDVVKAEQRGFAVERARGAKVPLAQLGCDGMDLELLTDLAAQADETMAIATAVDIDLALAELSGFACASWVEDNVVYVLLCDGDLAFNRLLAQVATMAIKP